MSCRLLLVATTTALAIPACDRKKLSDNQPLDAAAYDASTVDASDAATGPLGVVPYPGGCASDEECGGHLCRLGICVPAPPADREARFACDDTVVPASIPNLECWVQPAPLGSESRSARSEGVVEFFGDGSRTTDLRIRFYDYELFDPSPCLEAGRPGADVATARELTEACIDDHNEPVGETTSGPCEHRDDLGCYSVEGLPAGRHLVVRIDGEPRKWVPTYTYGVFINPCVNPHWKPVAICPEEMPDAPSDTNWSCSLSELGGEIVHTRDVTVISVATYSTFPPTAGVPRISRGNGALAGRQYDCDGRSLVNATVGFHRPGLLTTYFNGSADDTLPQPGLTYTNARGTYATLDAPAGPQGMVAVATQDRSPRIANYYRFFLVPDTVVILSPSGRRPLTVQPPY